MLYLTRYCDRLAAISFVVLLLFISACSSSGRSYTATGLVETLETNLLDNGSKMFVYRLRWPEDSIPSHIQIVRSSRTVERYQQSGVEVNRNTYKRLQQNAAYAVEQTGFCRTGFLELDGSVSRYHLWLKGECRESASAADVERFGKQQVLTVRSQN